jgi:CheY-like chemotaxis protein
LPCFWDALVAAQKPILIVEDETDAREALREFLQAYGFAVVCAENGQVALDEITSRHVTPSLILLDLAMPVMDGNDFVKRTRQMDEIKDVPLVVTTAHLPEQSPAATAIFVKPVRPERLLALLHELLDKN